jgi:hypothetical protein
MRPLAPPWFSRPADIDGDRMQTFVSSALGAPHEYRSWFSDQVGLVLLARSPAQVGGDLLCRPKGDTGDYKQVFHTHSEVLQVLSDFDAEELKNRK